MSDQSGDYQPVERGMFGRWVARCDKCPEEMASDSKKRVTDWLREHRQGHSRSAVGRIGHSGNTRVYGPDQADESGSRGGSDV